MESKKFFKKHGRWKLELSSKERARLRRFRDRHPVPYLRERATAILKIADGKSPHWVAKHGLLKPRRSDTVYEWIRRYMRRGVSGLFQKPRILAERLPVADCRTVYNAIITETPEDYGFEATRWTLKLLRQALGCLQDHSHSLSGRWYFLQRLRLRVKRGRSTTIGSADPEFQRKIRRLRAV